MKSAIVYYSLDGNTKMVAKAVQKKTDGDVYSLKPTKEVSKGFMKYFWGGRQVLLKKEPSLISKPNLESYDRIYIGSPIWAGTFSPPIRSLLSECNLKDKEIVFFGCHAGGGIDKAVDELKNILRKCRICGTMNFLNPLRDKNKFNNDFQKQYNKCLKN